MDRRGGGSVAGCEILNGSRDPAERARPDRPGFHGHRLGYLNDEEH